MKNKRYLRPIVEKTLWSITIFMIMLLVMLNDFELSFKTILLLVTWISIISINLAILKKWGRGLIFENED